MNRARMLNATIGDYRVTDSVGAGGMGEVFRAVHTRVGHVVALKVLGETGDHAETRRFIEEARIQSQLHHPNIAAFHDYFEWQGRGCIVMEYVDGQTLADRIRFAGPLPAAEALAIFRSIVETVAYIHRHRIIHRDIKSSNIKIARSGEVKLLDFGIARSDATPNATMPGKVMGTLEYISPERLNGEPADERSDLWSLGVLLHEMVAGQTPFHAASVGEVCERVLKGGYAPASALNPAVPREVESLIARCLRRRVAERYSSAVQLLEDVRQAAEKLQAHDEAPRPNPLIALVARAHRFRKAIGLAAATALLLVAAWLFFPVEPAPAGDTRTIIIKTTEGTAEVYRNSDGYLGATDLRFDANVGEHIELRLKRVGYAEKAVQITVGEVDNEFTFSLEKLDR
jgi:serine/threonine-protein kinase